MAKTSLLTNTEIDLIREQAENDPEASKSSLARQFAVSPRTIGRVLSGEITEGLETQIEDEDTSEYVMRTAYQKQKAQDKLRVANKMVRESGRGVNVLEELNTELIKTFDRHDMSELSVSHSDQGEAVGVIQISDSHFGEVVNEVSSNKYNLHIASSRLRQFVDRAKVYFNAMGVKSVLVAMTGDMINSDRRLDEITTNAENRSKIVFSAVDVLNQVLLDLNQDYNLTVASVCGNESRLGKDVGWVNFIASDNFDYTVHNILSYMHRESEGIHFVKMEDPLECVVEVNGQHFLLIHGHNGLAATGKAETGVAKLRSKYANHGINLRMVLFGHIHQAFISDVFCRSSGLPGGNAYSDKGLNLTSRSSQNIHIVHDSGNIDSLKIDLQEVDESHHYAYNEQTEAYKPTSKDTNTVVIQSVVI